MRYARDIKQLYTRSRGIKKNVEQIKSQNAQISKGEQMLTYVKPLESSL